MAIIVIVVSSLVIPHICAFGASEEVGKSSGTFLKIGVGARQAALGEAFCGLADDISAIYWNPAGLSNIEYRQFGLQHNKWFENINYEWLGLAQRMGPIGVIGISLNYLYMDDIQTTYASGDTGPSFTANDKSLGIVWGNKIGKNLSIGAGIKYIEEIIEEEKADAVAVDFGVLHNTPITGLTIGVSVQNLALSKMQFIDKDESLPLNIKGGIAYKLLNNQMKIVADVNRPIDNDMNLRMGFEYAIIDTFTVRAGYRTDAELSEGLSCGCGLKFKIFSLDYGYVPYGDLGNTYRLSLILNFVTPEF